MSASSASSSVMTVQTTDSLASSVEILAKLEELVLDRTSYVKSQDVAPFLAQALDELRSTNSLDSAHGNRILQVSQSLNDCFDLISLAFLATGRTQEAPATYAQFSIIQRLLQHLKEASFLSTKDLKSLDERIDALDAILDRTGHLYDPHFIALLKQKKNACQELYNELRHFLSNLSPELAMIYDRLVEIMRSISACSTKHKFPATEVQSFLSELEEIVSGVKEHGIIIQGLGQKRSREEIDAMINISSIGRGHPSGEELVKNLLTRSLLVIQNVARREGTIAKEFEDVYHALLKIRNQLEKIVVTQSWSMRETDLFSYIKQLTEIDKQRQNGEFVTSDGSKADVFTGRSLLYLVRKGYALVYQLMATSEPVSEALLPIYTQLKTLKKCLQELQIEGGVSSLREVYPYSLKLKSLDGMRVNGKFVVNNEVPEGQGPVERLFEECVRTVKELWDPAEGE